MPNPAVTIKDIAKAANVSFTTVSRALSGSQRISKERREEIVRLSEEMGYMPNHMARSMVVKETKTIGVIAANAGSPYTSEVIVHIEERAREKGYSIMLCNSCYSVDLEEKMFSLLLGKQVDGVIISPTSLSGSVPLLQRHIQRMPTVFLGQVADDETITSISADNFLGGEMGMQYLFDLGHKETIFLGCRSDSPSQIRRAEGYAQRCKALGLTPHYFNNPSRVNSISTGYELSCSLFREGCPYTAIFAATDIIALGILQAADEFGLRVPERLSVLGFDNISFAGLPRISLTTIDQPKASIGRYAVDMLIEKIQDPSLRHTKRVLATSIAERSTCAPVGFEG